MKNIQSIQIWKDGGVKDAVILNAYVINDNLKDTAVFYYQLLSSENEELGNGNVIMSNEDYQGFISNDYAYEFIANKLSITLI